MTLQLLGQYVNLDNSHLKDRSEIKAHSRSKEEWPADTVFVLMIHIVDALMASLLLRIQQAQADQWLIGCLLDINM